MTEHKWQKEEVASKGPTHYWVCRECGSSGGPVTEGQAPWQPFLAGTPLANLSADCVEAKKQIDGFVKKYPEWEKYATRMRTSKPVVDPDNPKECPHCGLPRPKDMNVWQCCSKCGKGIFSGCGPVDEDGAG